MSNYDKSMKSIFEDMTEDLVRLMTGNKVLKKEELNIEFTKVEKRQSDMVVKCEMSGTDTAVHIEFQSSNDNKMPYRMLRYCVEIMEKHDLPVYQLVLYMGEKKVNMNNTLNYFFDVNNMLNYKYQILDIGDLKFNDIVGNNAYGLYSLLPVVDREKRTLEKELYLTKCVKVIEKAPLDIEQKREIAFRAKLLAGLIFRKDIIDKIFSEVINMWRIEDSVVYQDVMEKGKGQGKVELLMLKLKRKFKTFPNVYEIKLQDAKEDIVDKIAENIFDIDKVEDLNKYLQ